MSAATSERRLDCGRRVGDRVRQNGRVRPAEERLRCRQAEPPRSEIRQSLRESRRDLREVLESWGALNQIPLEPPQRRLREIGPDVCRGQSWDLRSGPTALFLAALICSTSASPMACDARNRHIVRRLGLADVLSELIRRVEVVETAI